ncbi:DUF2938 domain-containing protein [Parahaliea mediterranea]|uniref:DUF2938 domain-containing protein n=1 Tax=Parahaliea mediterranea TaxID=651086 RepID=A0A939DJY5_9GAMM|nr:DUF2938 domain-containing protein [Parahaliea mediterranea]MBN7799181.1 DUF2938 domain-containing protein [Parahaliea mediterranea]
MNDSFLIVLTGIGATAVMDLWSVVRKLLFGIPPANWGLVGRWIAYLAHGQFRHDPITATPSVHGERFIGWTAHYFIGIAYAVLLVAIYGSAWIHDPSVGPALTVGIATVAAPFFIMQPGMGAGIAGSRTPRPNATRLQSVLNHAVFGLGMYVSAWGMKLAFST